MSILQITYCSRSRLSADRAEALLDAGNIAIFSAVRNRLRSVGGMLYFDGRYFAQVLEGPPAELRRLMTVIACDPRHADLTVIGKRALPAPAFGDWSMGFIGATDHTLEIFRRAFDYVDHDLSDADHGMMVGELCEMAHEQIEPPAVDPKTGAARDCPRHVFWDAKRRAARGADFSAAV